MNFWKVSRESLLFYAKILSFEIVLMTSFPGYWPAFNHKWVYREKQYSGKIKSTSILKCLEKTVRWKKSTKNKFQKMWDLEVNPGGLAHAHRLCLSQTQGCGMPAAREREKLEGTSYAELLRKDKMSSKEFIYYSTLDKDLFGFFF